MEARILIRNTDGELVEEGRANVTAFTVQSDVLLERGVATRTLIMGRGIDRQIATGIFIDAAQMLCVSSDAWEFLGINFRSDMVPGTTYAEVLLNWKTT